jgi:DNA-3-methyladenine glycosylase
VNALAKWRYSSRFYRRPADVVARALLGKVLVHKDRAGIIVETEAYLGEDDLASHARFGPTRRNEPMYGAGGTAYVYLIYGIHELFNVVTGPLGEPQAVLVRALEPVSGMDDASETARGPGKLTVAMGITRAQNRVDMTRAPNLYVARGRRVRDEQIRRGPRIGVDYAKAWAKKPLRFWIDSHPAVSGG